MPGLLMAFFVLVFFLPVCGSAKVKAPKKECHAYVVMDAGSGKVLFGQKENKKIYMLIHKKPQLFNTKESFYKLYNDIFSKILDKYQVGTDEQKYIFSFFSFGLVAIIDKWIENNCEDDIETLASIMKRVIGYQKLTN
jgi:hypothetical protein